MKKSIWKNSTGLLPSAPRHVYCDCSLGHGLWHLSSSGHSCRKPITRMRHIQWLGSSLFNNSHALDYSHDAWFTSVAAFSQESIHALKPPAVLVAAASFPFPQQQGTWSPLTTTCPISSVAQGLFLLLLFLLFLVVPLSFEAVINDLNFVLFLTFQFLK